MAIFERDRLIVISEQNNADLSKASLNEKLSAVNFDDEGKFFYMTIDRALFSNPVTTIRTVLDAHGFVPNLENILSCLDSFSFSAHSRVSGVAGPDDSAAKVHDYLPCIRFELPQKNRVGETLQSNHAWASDPEIKKHKNLKAEVESLKADKKELKNKIKALTHQLSIEQNSLSRASRALDAQHLLPDNTKIGRIDHVDLRQRKVKVKCNRKVIDIPTHLLDRVPDYRARCLLTFGQDDEVPLGIIFFDNEEIEDLEKRTAELLYVKGDSFKARDSNRNEFQISAVNSVEAETIKSLSRGMKVVISISTGYVVRFSVLGSKDPDSFTSKVQEQFIVHDIARNQLIAKSSIDGQET
jgi:hypothetical protein